MIRPVLAVIVLSAALSTPAAPVPEGGGVPAGDTGKSWNGFLGLGDLLVSTAPEMAKQFYEQQNFAAAAPYYEVLHRLYPADREIAKRLGFALKETGRYEESHDLLFQATVEDPSDYQAWWWLSDAQRLLGDYQKAFESMKTAQEAAPEGERQALQPYTDYTEALGTNVPSWDVFEKHREFAQRHERMRRVRRTIAEYMTALDTIPPEGPAAGDGPLRQGWVYNQIGIQYNQIKQPDLALDYFWRAVRKYGEVKSTSDVMMAYQNIGVTYRLLAESEPARAIDYFELGAKYWGESLAIARERKDPEYTRYAQAGQLLCLVGARGVDDAGAKTLREANLLELPWRGPVSDYTVAFVAVAELACRVKEGDHAGARIVAEMALPFYAGSGFLLDGEEAINIYLALAGAYTAQGHLDQAIAQAQLAQEKLEQLRGYMDADAFTRSANTAALRRIAVARARAEIMKGDPDAARRTLDAYFLRARRDLLGSKILDEAARNDFTTELELLKRNKAMLEADLAAAAGAGGLGGATAATAIGAEEAARLQARIAADTARAAWLEKGVRFGAARSVNYREVPLLGPAELAPSWPADTLAAAFAADARGGVWVIYDGTLATGALAPEATEAALQTLASTPDGIEALSSKLLVPVAEKLTAKTLYFAVDAVLAELPLELLTLGDRRLLDKHDIAYLPSISHLIHLTAAVRPTAVPVRLASEAAASDAIAAALPGAETCATETAFTQAATDAALAVVRAPLDLSAPDPMLAAFTLGSDSMQDGVVYAGELLAADARANTVWFTPFAGEGSAAAWLGLEEGCLQAGAGAVVRPAGSLPESLMADLLKEALAAGPSLASLSAAKRAALQAGGDMAAARLRVTGVVR